MRIPKLSLIFMVNEELTEIFKVKGKAQLPKIHQTYFHSYIFLPSGPQPHHLQANTILLNSPLLQPWLQLNFFQLKSFQAFLLTILLIPSFLCTFLSSDLSPCLHHFVTVIDDFTSSENYHSVSFSHLIFTCV